MLFYLFQQREQAVGFGRLVDTLGYGVSIYVLPLAMAAFIITFLAFSRGHGKEQQKN